MITLTTVYVEGERKTRTYKTLEGARKAAAKRFGRSPERGGGYVHDDYAVLYVSGATFDDIFPDSYEAKERAQQPSAARPYEVWSYIIDEQAGTSRAYRDAAFATLHEANQEAERLDEFMDGVHLVGTTEEAKAALKAQSDAYEAQLQRDRDEEMPF